MNLVLLGLRGSGKTTLGRRAAEIAGRAFVDLDDVTPSRLGCASVADAWNTCGQEAFRAAESAALREVLSVGGRVVALGGGTPTAPGCADMLKAQAAKGRVILVYLHAAPSALRSRLATTNISHRPSITGADPLDEIDALYAARDPLYRQLAGAVVDTESESPERLAALLAGLVLRD